MYSITIILRFCAAHKIDGYNGKCANLHGHNYKLELEVSATQLDKLGFVVDSDIIKQHVKPIIAQLDHQYLNELPGFAGVSPSAENIAKYIYEQCDQSLRKDRIQISQVTLWETDDFYVRYRK
ncbi:MAG: 6-carboxytetrahydropterin synthase QueD [Pseudomonadota bacterium]